MQRNFFQTAAITVSCLAGMSTAIAQNTNAGDIRGVVTDATGAVIPDALITVTDNDKGVAKAYHSNDAGLYDTGPIVTGNYRITFEKAGFEKYVRTSVSLQVGTITVDGKLSTGSVSEQVEVTTDVPLIKTESGEQSTTLEAAEMQKRPNVGQDWQNFVKFIPGAAGTASFGATGQALSINGNLPYNAVLADGASSALSHSGNADQSVFETVQEVQINTSAFSAQFGIGGAVFNQISKGGTNQFHGSLYEYAQNDAFNARSYFQLTKPYLRFHNFGGSVGNAGSIVLRDAAGLVVDSLNYGLLVDPWAAEGYQSTSGAIQNGCKAPVPSGPAGFGPPGANAPGSTDRSSGRFPDGVDSDSNCQDFQTQAATTLPIGSSIGPIFPTAGAGFCRWCSDGAGRGSAGTGKCDTVSAPGSGNAAAAERFAAARPRRPADAGGRRCGRCEVLARRQWTVGPHPPPEGHAGRTYN